MEYRSIWLLSGWLCLCRRRCGSACPRAAGLVGLHLLPTPSVRSAPICSLTDGTPLAVGWAAPNGRPECAGSTVMLTAEMGAPVAANGHAAEIILGFWATALGGPRDSWADTRSAAVARNLQIGSLIMRFSRAARSMSRASARSQRRAARLHQHFGMRAISAGVKTSTRITGMSTSNANAGDNGRAVDVQQMSIILQTSFEAAVVVRCCGSSRLRGRKSGEGSN